MSGEAQPPGFYKQTFLCEAFRILNNNHAMLSDTIERCADWEKNIDSLTTRMNRFSEQFESRCKTAIDSSKATIQQTAHYKLFDQDFDPSCLPSYFQNLYGEHLDKVNAAKSSILIDIGSELETVPNDGDGYNCDKIDSLDRNSNSEDRKHATSEGTASQDELASKLPPPLCPEVLNSPK